MIASGPFDARLRIGISISAQPELNVPITAPTSLFCAYAFAFAEHLPESHLPACAVESSQLWYASEYLPAFQPCCLRMKAIAFVISIVCVRPAPWSGRSEATRTLPLPFWIAEHDDAGSGDAPDRATAATVT